MINLGSCPDSHLIGGPAEWWFRAWVYQGTEAKIENCLRNMQGQIRLLAAGRTVSYDCTYITSVICAGPVAL
jgi:hypothetical protein